MIISLKKKESKGRAGHLKIAGGEKLILNMNIRRNADFFNDLQRLILKYFDVKVISQRKELKNRHIIDEIKDTSHKILKTGSVGRGLHGSERWKNEPEFRERRKKEGINYFSIETNKVKRRERGRKFTKTLNEFKNNRCKYCNKLLNWRTETNRCRRHEHL